MKLSPTFLARAAAFLSATCLFVVPSTAPAAVVQVGYFTTTDANAQGDFDVLVSG